MHTFFSARRCFVILLLLVVSVAGCATSRIPRPASREATQLLISVPAQPGGSGSPLLTMDGAVVGVVTAGTREEEFMRDTGSLPQNLNWAVKMEYATPLYDRPGGPGTRGAARTPRKVAEQAARAVCIVLAGP